MRSIHQHPQEDTKSSRALFLKFIEPNGDRETRHHPQFFPFIPRCQCKASWLEDEALQQNARRVSTASLQYLQIYRYGSYRKIRLRSTRRHSNTVVHAS